MIAIPRRGIVYNGGMRPPFAAFLACSASLLPGQEDVLDGLRPEPPRLLLTDERLAGLKERHARDEVLQRYVRDVFRRAEGMLDAGPLTYDKRGPRLLHVSRRCLDRVRTLGLAHRWTGEERFAEKALQHLREVCQFPDWNPSHFLDTAEMSHAVGLGYDWLHGWLGEERRRPLREALVRLGLKPGIRGYDRNLWWTRTAYNWNQVCNGGLLVGALAIAGEDPGPARTVISEARRSLPRALASYEPDGGWAEGPAYWSYATRYTVHALSALRTALGTDLGLADRPALERTGRFPIHGTGPTGLYFNFADAGTRARRRPLPELFWLARAYDDPFLAGAEHRVLEDAAARARHVIDYVPPGGGGKEPARDRRFRGPVEIATFRSAWGDPRALYVATKAGVNRINHGQLDQGTFVLDALGVRWAEDLGKDDYNMPGYFDMGTGGKRWTYDRNRSVVHNVPLVDGRDQDPDGGAEILRFAGGERRPFVVLDLTGAYRGVEKLHRGIALPDRRAVLVQDEVVPEGGRTVTWGLTTRAEVGVDGSGRAELRRGERTLIARILAPEGARFDAAPVPTRPPQASNEGYTRLTVEVNAEQPFTMAVLLEPRWEDEEGDGGAVDELRALSSW